jgi:hypothetical protein
MPPHTVAYWALILLPFLGSGECLRLTVMFHRDRKWRVSLVKKKWQGERRSIFDHDNAVARYIWGVIYAGRFLSVRDKKATAGVEGLCSGGSKILLLGMLGGANGLCILRLQIICIYFVAMLPADGREIDAIENEA